jgi:hypothetical protein
MKPTKLSIALVASVVMLGLSAACGGAPKANPAACKEAMRAEYADTSTPGTRPPECHDMNDTELQQIAGELVEERLRDAFATPTP